MRKVQLNLDLVSESSISHLIQTDDERWRNDVLSAFPPNKPLELCRAIQEVRDAFEAAIYQMNQAHTTAGNSEWTRDQLANDMESLERAYRNNLGGHDNTHEIYNCLSTMRNRIELEIRREFPLDRALQLYLLLEVLCTHFIQQNKAIDVISDFIFSDGKKFRRNRTLLFDKEKRLEARIAIESLESRRH